MSKKKDPAEDSVEETVNQPAAGAASQTGDAPLLTNEEIRKLIEDSQAVAAAYAEERDRSLRMAAEYDNFRKRTQKEKDALYQTAQADTIIKFLPVYDNISLALCQPTCDEAYAKGVEMIAAGLDETLEKLGATSFGAPGDPFDPEKHSAVMHIQDENLGENVVAEVFRKGFLLGDKIIRFAMVKAAN